MEAELYLPVYRQSFREGNSIFSPWRLSRFVTKLFKYHLQNFTFVAGLKEPVGVFVACTDYHEGGHLCSAVTI